MDKWHDLEISLIGDENIIYASGCIGHGVFLTQLNGRLIADLISSIDSDISKSWIVNLKALPIPLGNFLPYMGVKPSPAYLNASTGTKKEGLNPQYPPRTNLQFKEY
jgi:hypothetical protein